MNGISEYFKKLLLIGALKIQKWEMKSRRDFVKKELAERKANLHATCESFGDFQFKYLPIKERYEGHILFFDNEIEECEKELTKIQNS
jgi:hypothetical protein